MNYFSVTMACWRCPPHSLVPFLFFPHSHTDDQGAHRVFLLSKEHSFLSLALSLLIYSLLWAHLHAPKRSRKGECPFNRIYSPTKHGGGESPRCFYFMFFFILSSSRKIDTWWWSHHSSGYYCIWVMFLACIIWCYSLCKCLFPIIYHRYFAL